MSRYGPLSRMLHSVALGYPAISETLHDLELSLFKSKLMARADDKHVFVAGLARAGTTVLMRALHENCSYGSLTYRDMPFVLSPNLWAGLSGHNKRHMQKEQRAHGDGLEVDFDSPEALDEVFWRTHYGSDYIGENCLYPMQATEEMADKFRQYISLILLRHGKSRYLSKNNNNLLRLDVIRRSFPGAIILIPFRNPEQQAQSLLRQHLIFTDMHRTDPFSRKYMSWLAHHEFGSDHRPFRFGEDKRTYRYPENIDYWLECWTTTYSYLENHAANNDASLIFVSYEMLCSEKETVWRRLMNITDCTVDQVPDFRLKNLHQPTNIDKKVAEEATRLYDRLYERSESIFLK